ncbi:bifunctional glutamate N-acetyltransferase/amino-acid acetyltransferase ArgJ [Desulfopila sp. IMCC35006]|uniref:bifunctional glutamate N-acetyltransferase/amino-acid acetyltransferase ArgJ n=1 Tax=Desulfopila sp. IMCC35006 TaxID=2569542 RepID=UPI0010AC8F72|nr:bifunctional glutamate N-acetyltransferase/amino-acid acetyltransferase ArgJ [Desulfopila sp. IMCC35006]TKB27997.1 bifunctional glutamate N-acetyltransferase/amino-acid acetyltransferase ArgJ [Desulfopila sp. IMCC35006]
MKIKGFSFSAVKAGIRYADRLDLGLIYSNIPCVTAGVFTTNQVKAAPVILDKERLKSGHAQAILVNSGCANACTGVKGMEAAKATSSLAAEALGIAGDLIQVASTGVIGEPLNVEAFERSMPALVAGLSGDNFEQVAQAIMTTDTVQKIARTTVTIGGKEVQIMGMAKGAGMIMPNMATMLAFIFTDARINFPELHKSLVKGADRTFNRITIDGDTSTNDMVLVMANGMAENPWIDGDSPEEQQLFQDALENVLKDLALQIVSDGEGATKTITIRVCGAKENKDAEKIARTIGTSSLVKTAFFGEDANWGRILAAMGRSGVRFSPDRVDLAFGNVLLVKNGLSLGKEAEAAASLILKEKSFAVCIDLKDGPGCEEVFTCDFSIDYVKINADYRS